jgi:ABC-type amino acid transport system permease subunit
MILYESQAASGGLFWIHENGVKRLQERGIGSGYGWLDSNVAEYVGYERRMV